MISHNALNPSQCLELSQENRGGTKGPKVPISKVSNENKSKPELLVSLGQTQVSGRGVC